jgi:hypothetical protein
VRSIIEKAIDTDSLIYLAFIDFKAAFDTVPKKSLWKALDEYGIDRNLKGKFRVPTVTISGNNNYWL